MDESLHKRARGRPIDPGKRKAALDATRVIFFESGFEGVTMEGVAAAAGISKITLYKYFGDREELISELIGRESVWMEDEIAEITGQQVFEISSMVRFGVTLITFLSRPDVMALDARMAQAPKQFRPSVAKYFAAGPARLHAALKLLLASGEASGTFRFDRLDAAIGDLMALWLAIIPLPTRLGLAPPPSPAEIDTGVKRATSLFAKMHMKQAP
jgi:TetR/AcrR family transcriptional regulator, mexJK operon transcriptional repressor